MAQTYFQVFLAIAAKCDIKIKQLDVDLAILYEDFNDKIYLEQPKGF